MRRRLAVALALALASSSSAAAANPCSIHGDSVKLGKITISTGGPPITLLAEDVPATVWPDRRENRLVTVDGPLKFVASAELLPIYVSVPVVARPLELGRGADLERVRQGGASLIADARLDTDFVARDVRVPCEATALGVPDEDTVPALSDPLARIDPKLRGDTFTARQSILIFSEPGRGDAVRIDGGPDLFEVRDRPEGPWVHVVTSFEHVGLDGYVARNAVQEISGRTGIGGIGMGGCYTFDRSFNNLHVARGTKVYAEPGRHPWATVVLDTDFAVGNEKNGWVPIQVIDGLRDPRPCGLIESAWVRATP